VQPEVELAQRAVETLLQSHRYPNTTMTSWLVAADQLTACVLGLIKEKLSTYQLCVLLQKKFRKTFQRIYASQRSRRTYVAIFW